jgi:hypothetical protein
MHSNRQFRELLQRSVDEEWLKRRSYAQLGAGMFLFLLLLTIAFFGEGGRQDGGAAQTIAAAHVEVPADRTAAGSTQQAQPGGGAQAPSGR